jgi:hypothetical protein
MVVYFAGHGDKNTIHLGDERYERHRLETVTDSPKVDVKIVIVDACRTMDTGRHMGVSAGPGFDVSIIRSSGIRGRVTIQSSQLGEPSHESDRLKGAVFSHHLIGGLRGAADTDADGKITLLEAYRYAYRGTVKDSARGSSVVQHPNFDIDLSGTEDVVMTTPVAASSRLVLTSDEAAVFQVFSLPYFSPVAEFSLLSNKAVTVAVPSGRLLVQRRAGDRVAAIELKLSREEKRIVSPYEFTEMSVDITRRRGTRVDTRPNVARLAAVTSGDHFVNLWIPRFGGTLGYERRFRYIKTSLDFSTTYARYETDDFTAREIDLILSLGVGWARSVRIHYFGVSLGPFFETRFQHRTRLDAERLRAMGFGDHVEERLRAFAPGGFVSAKWDVSLTTRLDFSVEVRGSLGAIPIVRDKASSRGLSAAVGAATGLNYRF